MVGVLGNVEVKSGDCKAAQKAMRTRDGRTTTIWMTLHSIIYANSLGCEMESILNLAVPRCRDSPRYRMTC
jgi:hypothetical protein